MIMRFEAWKSGNILAINFDKKIYEFCGVYTGRILEHNSNIATHKAKVLGDIDLKSIEQELRRNGFKQQYKNEEGQLCLK